MRAWRSCTGVQGRAWDLPMLQCSHAPMPQQFLATLNFSEVVTGSSFLLGQGLSGLVCIGMFQHVHYDCVGLTAVAVSPCLTHFVP